MVSRLEKNRQSCQSEVEYEQKVEDQCQYLCNYAPTPPMTQQRSTDNMLGLMLG